MKHITLFDTIESFESERLYAHKITSNDLDKLIAMHTNPEVMATLGGTRSQDETLTYLDWNVAQWRHYGFGLWMFFQKDTGKWVGCGGLRTVKVRNQRQIEICYELMPEFWQQGYATEITRASMEVAFEVLRLNDIIGFTQATNEPSRRVMEKVGFEYQTDFEHRGFANALYKLQSYRKADVVPYDEQWPRLFELEADRIQNAFGSTLRNIHHIGSTSIPNMPAKQIIDIMLECEDISDTQTIKNKLRELDYRYIRRHVIPHHTYFTNRHDEELGYNIHITERGNPQIKRHVLFRDYLIEHPEDAGAYAELKLKLSSEYREDINQYVVSKDKLVQAIDTKAKLWSGQNNQFLSPNTSRSAQTPMDKLIKTMEANLNMHMTHLAQYINHVELIRVPGYTLVNSGLNDDTFNYVLDADLTEAGADKTINEVTNYFTQRNLPFSWWVSPNDKPESLVQHLEKCGYQHAEDNIAMYCDLDDWQQAVEYPPELEIRRALDKQSLQDFAMVLTNDDESFSTYHKWLAEAITEDDPIEYYVGYVDGKPVTRGLISFFAGVAGLHWLSTIPEQRKKGYGTALQQFRLQRAKDLGYRLAVLQASQMGYPLYLKLGYKECGVFREFKLASP